MKLIKIFLKKRSTCFALLYGCVFIFLPFSQLYAQHYDASRTENFMPIWINWDYNCHALDQEGIAQFVQEAVATGIQGISIRISNKGALNYRSTVGEQYTERLNAFGKDYDPLRILIAECKKQGISSGILFDLYEAAYDSFLSVKPMLSPQGLPGKPAYESTYCYAEPEVRRHVMGIVKEIVSYGPDRVFFCTKSSHIPSGSKIVRNGNSGYNLPAIERYRKLYGDNTQLSEFDRNKLSLIHGEFLIDFLVEARKLLNSAGIESVVGATLSGRLQIGGNILLDWRRLIERKAADALCMANTRQEYYVFYNREGQNKFRQIVAACHKAGMRFYPYIISSGTHSVISEKFGLNALLDYVPRQVQYLQALGGEGLIIHDLDLFAFDPNIRHKLWEAVGKNRLPVDTARALIVPEVNPELSSGKTAFSLDGVSHRILQNGSFESRKNSSNGEKPDDWESEIPKGSGVLAIYDWKVLHNSSISGRNFDGRSSVLLSVTPEVSKEDRQNARASWRTKINFPDRPEVKKKVIRVRVHGEDLKGIAKAGIRVEQYNRDHGLINTLNIPAPVSGDFPWKAIEAECAFDRHTRYVEIYLYLITDETGNATGRLWFDKLEFDSQ